MSNMSVGWIVFLIMAVLGIVAISVICFVGRVLFMWLFGTAEILEQQKLTNELLRQIAEISDEDYRLVPRLPARPPVRQMK